MGRPTLFNQDLANKIAERIAEGETLKSICSEAAFPNVSTILRWEIANREFCTLLTRAREVGAHSLMGENREIADDARNDWMEKRGRDGESLGWQLNGEAVARSRLRIEQRWKEAQALAPRTYGQKYQVEHTGGEAADLVAKSDAEIEDEINELLASGRFKLPSHVAELIGDDEIEADELDPDDDPYGVG